MSLFSIIISLIHILLIIVPVLLSVAFITLGERKALGYMQARKGPTLVGPYGLLQPIADGVKLFIKEPIKPSSAASWLFLATPILALTIALILWVPMTFPHQFSSINLSLIFILTLSSLAVYTILGSGWASNSKYALLGAIRAVAQTISYEVSLGLTILCIIVLAGNFNLTSIYESQTYSWFILTCAPVSIMWYISTLAETNRSPFDLAEGESELVSGFNVEYAGGPFALFFLAEYSNIIFMNALSTILLLGGGSPLEILGWPQTILVALKITFLSFVFLWVRASYPRYRYDQLMHLAWKTFLPLSLGLLTFIAAIPIALDFLPPY
ncbi:NADH dehydrogenase subunit 1 (mitochondrion) [Saccoglossus kowalevskii]|uniref:NADH-ubiquinone oxidoreductase chain 1 n=1 Tax=Saccoglossus kowalevskii TaxID=10224 RepID=Q3L8S8_SACKO|nr:NADH dehydrogenase subunit 1 [Saccoglossus kowalevskii]AAQ92990.1 NADH dehydrogenase subunit 1 [Saccoglossus kowalevskii]